ncbi:hypothetical protein [Intestinibacter sp.]
MDDVKSKKTQEIRRDDFFELVKLIVFSAIGSCVFFLPLIINRQVVFPVFFITDLVYLKYEQFVYICIIAFIALLCIKEIGKKEKSIYDKIDIVLKLISLVIFIILITKNEFIFFRDDNLVQIMKESIFKVIIFLPISSIFLPLLLDYGLLYIFDCCFGRFTKKFFRTSGKNILIFALFFFVDSFLGFYVVYKLYKEGKLRKNEATHAILNYPILHISIVAYIASRLKINFILLVISYLFIFTVTNLILCRIYPIKNKEKTFFIKNKFKEKSYKKNKFKMSILLYLENREKKNLFKNILNYFNQTINIASNIIPVLLIAFLFIDIIIRNSNIVSMVGSIYESLLIKLRMPYPDYIAKCIVLGFFNQIYSIEVLNNGISFISRLTIAIIIICQGISLTTNIIFIRIYMRFINYKDILLVYLEKVLIMTFIVFLIYYFYLGFSA